MSRITILIIGIITILILVVLKFKYFQISNDISFTNAVFNPMKSIVKSNGKESKVGMNIVPHIKTNVKYLQGALKFDNKNYIINLHHKGDLISGFILKTHTWETHLTTQVSNLAKLYLGRMQFLDVGCNLGVYSMLFASKNISGIAIDGNPENVNRLVQSLLVNKLGSNIKVLLNVVADRRTTFKINVYNSNIGGSMAVEDKTSTIKAIYLDDLVELLDRNLPIFMKIDIETYEPFAFKKAHKLFQNHNIEIVLIEWMGIKKLTKNGLLFGLMEFLYSRGYKAFASIGSVVPELNVTNYFNWPNDVFFCKLKVFKV